MTRFACLVFVLVASLAPALAWWPDGRRGAAYVVLHVGLSALMLVALAGFRGEARLTRWLLGAGLFARVLSAWGPTFTSNDVHRYLWDGHLFALGLDPWRLSPNQVEPGAWPLPPDNLNIPSLYPPGAMALFAGAAHFGPVWGPWLWRTLVVLASSVTLVVVERLLREGPTARWLPLVALNPLLVLEGGIGGHLDLVVALSVVLALSAWRAQRLALLGVWVGVGALLKFAPVLLLLPLVVAAGLRPFWRALGATAAVLALGYGAALALGLSPLGSLSTFAAKWRFGSPLTLIDRTVPALTPVLAIVLGLVGLGLTVWRTRRRTFEAGVSWALLTPWLASPVVFPWYLAPAVAASALAPSAMVLAWMTLGPLSYEVIDTYRLTGRFEAASWPLGALAAGMMVAAYIDLLRLRRNAQ